MKMTKIAGRTAALLCAAAVMLPTAAFAIPATVASAENVSSISYKVTNIGGLTGNQYVPVGGQIYFDIRLKLGDLLDDYTVSDFTYEWYYSDDQVPGTESADALKWTRIEGNGNVFTDTMTREKNMRHYLARAINTKTGDVIQYPVRTVSCMTVQTKLGAGSVETIDDKKYLVVPVYMKGFVKNQVSGLTLSLKTERTLFENVEFDSAIGGNSLGDYKDDGEFRYTVYTVINPMTIGSDYKVGDFYLEIKDGAEVKGTNLELDVVTAFVTGKDLFGYVVYGTTPVSQTISVSSDGTFAYPTNINVQYNPEYHQARFTWDAVEGADKYGIAVLLAGKWRVQTSEITATSYTTPKNLTPGKTYKVAVAARVNGVWDTENALKNAVTVTVE